MRAAAAVQATKRLAQLAVDTDRDVSRLTSTLRAFERLSAAEAAAAVEATLAECLEGALGLAGVRLFLVDRRRKRATACSGPKTTVTWKGAALEQQASLVAWCDADRPACGAVVLLVTRGGRASATAQKAFGCAGRHVF